MRGLASFAWLSSVTLDLRQSLRTFGSLSALTVFLRNLQRIQAPSFLISDACFLCSGRNGPFLRPTRFSVSTLGACGCLRIVGFVALLFEFFLTAWRLPGGDILPVDVGDRCGDEEVLILMGLTTDEVTMVGRVYCSFSCLMGGEPPGKSA